MEGGWYRKIVLSAVGAAALSLGAVGLGGTAFAAGPGSGDSPSSDNPSWCSPDHMPPNYTGDPSTWCMQQGNNNNDDHHDNGGNQNGNGYNNGNGNNNGAGYQNGGNGNGYQNGNNGDDHSHDGDGSHFYNGDDHHDVNNDYHDGHDFDKDNHNFGNGDRFDRYSGGVDWAWDAYWNMPVSQALALGLYQTNPGLPDASSYIVDTNGQVNFDYFRYLNWDWIVSAGQNAMPGWSYFVLNGNNNYVASPLAMLIGTTADVLGIDPQTVFVALNNGESLSQIAYEHGMTRDQLFQGLLASVQQNDNVAMTNGWINGDGASFLFDVLSARISGLMDQTSLLVVFNQMANS